MPRAHLLYGECPAPAFTIECEEKKERYSEVEACTQDSQQSAATSERPSLLLWALQLLRLSIASLSFPLETGDCGRPHEPLGMGLKGSELRTTVGDSSQICQLLIAAPSHLSSHALTAPSLHTDQSSSLFRPFAKEKQALGVYSTCEWGTR